MSHAAPSDDSTTAGGGSFEQVVPIAPGLSVTVKITGNDDAIARGDDTVRLVADLFTDSPANTLPETTYNFSGTVECPFSYTAGGTTYEFVATFTPDGEPSDSGDSRDDVEHLLGHGLTFVFQALVGMLYCAGVSAGVLDPAMMVAQALSSLAGPGMFVLGGLPGSPSAGSSGRFGSPMSFWPDDPDSPYGRPD